MGTVGQGEGRGGAGAPESRVRVASARMTARPWTLWLLWLLAGSAPESKGERGPGRGARLRRVQGGRDRGLPPPRKAGIAARVCGGSPRLKNLAC